MSGPVTLQARLVEVFRDCLDAPGLDLQPGTRMRDIPHFDSAKMVTLVLAVETHFNVRLKSREIDALQRFGDWFALLKSHGIDD